MQQRMGPEPEWTNVFSSDELGGAEPRDGVGAKGGTSNKHMRLMILSLR